MPNGRGGARPGSGRKPGSKTRPRAVLSARLRARLMKIRRSEDAKTFAASWLALAEPELLRRVMESDDLKIQVEVWKELRRYAYGAPPQSLAVTVSQGPSPAEILRQVWEERLKRQAVTVEAVPQLSDGSGRRTPEGFPRSSVSSGIVASPARLEFRACA